MTKSARSLHVKLSLSTSALALLAAAALAGCPESAEETGPVTTTATASATTAPTASTTPLVPSTASSTAPTGNKPPIEPRAKAELDNKDPTNTAGNALAVEGTKAAFVVPTAWTTTKSGAWHVSTTADQKSKFAAGSFGTEDPNSKLAEVATAMGYTECEWGTPESISMGKEKIPTSVADGVCLRAGAPVRTAYATMTGEGLNVLAVGGWDTGGGSAAEVFEIFRNAKKAAGGDATGIAACCAALAQNAKSAPPQQQGAYLAAAGACNAVRSSPQGRAALAQVRAMLAGANVPAQCR
jgi:hypothetical protein